MNSKIYVQILSAMMVAVMLYLTIQETIKDDAIGFMFALVTVFVVGAMAIYFDVNKNHKI